MLAALGYGVHSVYLKRVSGELDRVVVAWGTFLGAAPIFGGLVAWEGVPVVGTGFWWAFAVSVAANLVAWPMFVRALAISDLSLVMPMLAFTPGFMLGTEYLLLGAVPGAFGWLGIALVVLGAYVLNVEAGIGHVLEPFRALRSDTGAMLMLGVSAIWSVSATVEKVTVTESSPAFYLAMLSGALAVGLVPAVYRSAERPWREAWGGRWALVGAAGIFAGMMIVQMTALQTAPVVNYVIAIKRLGLVVSVGAGFWWFGEKNVLFRALGVAVMVVGAVFIRMA